MLDWFLKPEAQKTLQSRGELSESKIIGEKIRPQTLFEFLSTNLKIHLIDLTKRKGDHHRCSRQRY